MWYRLCIYDSEKKNKQQKSQMKHLNCYLKKKAKFESIFLRDNGKRLKRLINNSFNASTIWEIPKGSKNNNETDLDCAKREFGEESNIHPDKYTILYHTNPIISTHVDNGIIYRSIYYIAYIHANNTWKPKVSFKTSNQISEVEQIQWVSLQEINFLNLDEQFKTKTKTLYRHTMKEFKKNIKSYYYDKLNVPNVFSKDTSIYKKPSSLA
jgi:8-oxo-dGTP pyrophosphatase MutT (NUDIX family)